MSDMTEVQRALWLEWLAADKAFSTLIWSRPILKDDPSEEEREAYRVAMWDHREKTHHAEGYRDGLRKACCIAKVPNFTEE